MTANPELRDLALAVQTAGGRLLVVGGAVRDHFLAAGGDATNPKDVDCEVFGIEADRLLTLLQHNLPSGCDVNCVGASFGVFKVRTSTGREFDVSIPRRDSKSGVGHKGFTITGDPDMSVEDAARRRDFTMNAISFDPLTGEFLDPFHGRRDIEHRVLRVVDLERFGDDSLRVLRAVQFAARFNFVLDEASWNLCRDINLSDLPAERVWVEMEKLLRSPKPSVGLRLALELDVVQRLWPELWALHGVPQDAEWHPEGDVWTHTLLVVDASRRFLDEPQSCDHCNGLGSLDEPHLLGGTCSVCKGSALKPKLSPEHDITVMLAALCHDLGKPATTAFMDGRWRSLGHEQAGVEPAFQLLTRLNVNTVNGYDVRKQVLALVDQHLRPFEFFKTDPGPAAFRRLALKVDLNLLARVAEADDAGRHPKLPDPVRIAWFRQRVSELNLRLGAPAPILLGRHLLEMGFKPGPDLGKLLKAVYERQLDGSVTTLPEAMLTAVWLQTHPAST
jgi:tRNA nucleotidyltransferase (CCA-adding enzyme)